MARARAAAPKKRPAPKAKSDGVVLKKAARKRIDALGDGVDQLNKIVDRLNKQVKEMAANVAEARDAASKGKKKKKKK